MSRLFTYGTLRRFGYNYYNFKLDKNATYLYTCAIKDLEMYDIGGYPIVISGAGSVIGDLFEVHNESIVALIDKLERSYGYIKKNFSLHGSETIIYIFENLPKNVIRIDSGNWVTYISKRY